GNQRNDMERLLQKAKQIDAELMVVYMLYPTRDTIEFDDLGELMLEYFGDNFPDELDELSTHTRLEEVYIESITDIHLDEKMIEVTGEASLSVSLQYGSDREQEEDDEDMEMTFPMDYTATVNWNREIVAIDYEIDTDRFYE
ncbi:MAG: hypothetical protein PUE95_12890, partial [Lachnospiraceae bacterium]|nr:hypothetical protein [Lachnospiraceae bacterium]